MGFIWLNGIDIKICDNRKDCNKDFFGLLLLQGILISFFESFFLLISISVFEFSSKKNSTKSADGFPVLKINYSFFTHFGTINLLSDYI